uniref:Mei2-like C-terminal RNA recognition motif domain-containing protein n=1 Tax=Alexandrium catenella TaxID=2925 RepID=A0A7S1RL67_ALECA|mmetsp:Transcript_6339/g.17024  ORF Transcript_6339/g.17024 Transcript_6339/m.17024 type:complete len:122 (+) Transcript_6339:219-584(+)
MVGNINKWLTHWGLSRLLDERLHLGGLYDYIFIPRMFDAGKNKGFAFVNFITEEAGLAFARRFPALADPTVTDDLSDDLSWRVTPARVQGIGANLAVAGGRRQSRVQNNKHRPLILLREAA